MADVIATLGFARAHDLATTVRAGGHSVAGRALCDGGVVIDLTRMNSVRVDPATKVAWVEGDATLRDLIVDTPAQASSRARHQPAPTDDGLP